MHALEVGMSSSSTHIATPDTLADRFGNPGMPVLATPYLVSLAESECVRCVAGKLEPGTSTVGARLDVLHMAATPAGMQFTIRAVLKEIDKRRLVFEVQATDEVEMCFMGVHERAIVDTARFLERAQAKARRLAP
jgi:fluoroacetyl-CoA thioesterase